MTDARTDFTPGLDGLGDGITKEAAVLDASLDNAFVALREIRASSNKLVAPASDAAVADSGSAEPSVPDALVKMISGEVRDVAAGIYETLNMAGAPPDTDSAARRTADALESWADKIEEEIPGWADSGQMPPDSVARILSEARSEAQGLQRRIGGPAGRLMSIMQLRDNMDQRTAHVVSGANIGMNAEGGSRGVVEHFLAAQVRDMSASVREGGEAVAEAIGVVEKLTSALRSQIGIILARAVAPKAADALERALESRTDWGSFKSLSESAAAFEDLYHGAWTDMMVAIGYQWAGKHMDVEGASKIADLLDVTAGMLAAATTLDEEAQNMAAAAIRIDALSDSLQQECESSDVKDNPVLTALWDTYTVESERDVHTTLVQRLAV